MPFNEKHVLSPKTFYKTSFNQIVDVLDKNLGSSIKATHLNNPIKNYVYRTLADITHVKQELGYKPKWNLDSGVKQLVKLHEKSELLVASEA